MNAPVVIDIETQNTFREVGGHKLDKLKVSLVGAYDYATDQYLSYTEGELNKLFQLLENASTIIGFNIIEFDLPVLASYYVGDITKFPTVDLIKHVEKAVGFRVSLDNLAKETLGTQKNGHGLMAIEYFRTGQIDKLREYCLNDVKITRQLYEYGNAHQKVFFPTPSGKREVPVSWEYQGASAAVNLTFAW